MYKSADTVRRSKRLKEKIEGTKLTFIWNKEHPLLNELILDNIFCYWKGKSNEIAHLRVVCQTWDREITRITRKETQINFTKIVSSYPRGMGWTLSSTNLKAPFYYKAPYTQVRSFENIFLNANQCVNLRSVKWISWFRVMGSQVKRLQFSANFTCFCQNHFLEQIVKDWCPNIRHLDLCNVKCVDSLLFVSSFSQIKKELKCTGLKTLSISVDGDDDFSLCKNQVSTVNSLKVLDIKIRKLCMKLSTWKIVDFIYDYGLDSTNLKPFPEFVSAAGKKIALPVYLNGHQKLPDLSPYFTDSLKPTDGGIIGQIMKHINVEKFKINGFDDIIQGADLMIFLHIRPHKCRESLTHLELNNTFVDDFKLLDGIGQVRFPLSVIKLGEIHFHWNNNNMTKFLAYFMDTLKHLEISGRSVREANMEIKSELIIPKLPKLETFVHENIAACHLSAFNLWGNAPNMMTCYLSGCCDKWNAKRFFEDTAKPLSATMRDFKLAVPIFGKKTEMILAWFPNLVKMEIVVHRLGTPANKFFGKLGKSKVVELKFGFMEHKLNSKAATTPWKKNNIAKLKFLELNNKSNLPCRLTTTPFAKGQLTSLKLTNFWISGDEKEILMDLYHIPDIKLEKVKKM